MSGNPKKTIEEFLTRARSSTRPLGSDGSQPIRTEDVEFLKQQLIADKKVNNILLASAVVMLYGIFALAALLVWHYRNDQRFLTMLLGGDLFSLTILVGWLRQLWLDKNLVDLARNAILQLEPSEATKLISDYFELTQKSKATMKARTAAD
jgi:hypothetical protein